MLRRSRCVLIFLLNDYYQDSSSATPNNSTQVSDVPHQDDQDCDTRKLPTNSPHLPINPLRDPAYLTRVAIRNNWHPPSSTALSVPSAVPSSPHPYSLPRPLDGNLPPQGDHFINYRIRLGLSHTHSGPGHTYRGPVLDGVPLGQLGKQGINNDDALSLTVFAAVTFTPDLPPADTNPAGHRPHAHSLYSALMLPKAVVIGCGGGSRIRALDGIFESTRCHRPRLDTSRKANEPEEGQQGTAGAATTILHTFISSQAHVLMLESTPNLLKSVTWTDDPTPFLAITGYC